MRKVESILVLLVAGSFAAAAQQPVKPAADTAAKASSSAAAPAVVTEKQGENVRTGAARAAAGGTETASVGPPREINIGFIDSPSSTCYQPDPTQDICYINWYYLSVDASPNYMISMSVRLNDKGVVATTQGFFQTSMYVPYNMRGNGIKVQCGALQNPDPAAPPCSPQPCTNPNALGNAYAFTIRARDSANLGSANYGTVYCPAFIP